MPENPTSDPLCPHPEHMIQSGIYARGVYCHPVCMACGEQLLSRETIEILESIEHEEDIHD